MSRIVAAFEPFAGRAKNRAQRAARHLHDDPGVEVVTLPVSFARLRGAIRSLVETRPTVLLLVGESSEARELRIERFALNLAHARIADNDGAQPQNEALEPAGPLALGVGFDVAAVVEAITRTGVPAVASAHAGTFCCNAALYWALSGAKPDARYRIGFVHVPANRTHMRGKTAAAGLRAALAALSTHTI